MTPGSCIFIIAAVLAQLGCECDALQWTRIHPIAQSHRVVNGDHHTTALRASALAEVKAQFLSRIESPIDDNAIYACPESLNPLVAVQRFYGPFTTSYFVEPEYGTTYSILPHKYYDLTLPSEKKSFWQLTSRERAGQRFFQTRLIPSIYERGYRQNFENFGFPGIELEFEEAKGFFVDANATSVVMDLSCGSGFMTRKFMNSSMFDRIIAADLSPTMLEESRRRFEKESLPFPEFIRCDSAKLPLRSDSISAIHAGAAMHCWPNLNESLSEIYRVLKPGGAFFASTFFTPSLGARGRRAGLKQSANQQGFYLFADEQEIYELVTKAGFSEETGSQCVVRKEGNRCAIVKAVKGRGGGSATS